MVIDSSALVAIVRGEIESVRFQRLIEADTSRVVSAATWVEASMVMLSRFGEAGVRDLADFVGASNLEIVPFAGEHVALALEGFCRFGKGRHAAGLNFGDCFSYALSKATGQPLSSRARIFRAPTFKPPREAF